MMQDTRACEYLRNLSRCVFINYNIMKINICKIRKFGAYLESGRFYMHYTILMIIIILFFMKENQLNHILPSTCIQDSSDLSNFHR